MGMKLHKWFELARDAVALVRMIVRLFRGPRPPRTGHKPTQEPDNGQNQL